MPRLNHAQSRNDLTAEALSLVEKFTELYPPNEIAKPFAPKDPADSNRVLLEGPRPLVRLSSVIEIGDDTVPPMLTFRDVEVLHHRFVVEEDEKALAKLTYHVRSYQGAIRSRKASTLKSLPVLPAALMEPESLFSLFSPDSDSAVA